MGKGDTVSTGRKGEDIATTYLRQKGFTILERNFRTRWGEIDIVARLDKTIVFVEVKAKRGVWFGEPWEMVDRRKILKLRRVGETYMSKRGVVGGCRIDVVSVVLRGDGVVERIAHYEAVD